MLEGQHLTDCELLVIKVIWESEEKLSLIQIMDRVNEKYRKAWKSQTVSTFLGRIVRRGFLTMERKGRQFYYTPVVSEEEYATKEILHSADFWCNGRADVMLAKLLKERTLSDEEKAGIRKLLDAAN